MVSHYALQNRCQHTINTKRSKNTFYSAPTITSFTLHNTRTWQWERNEGYLTTNFEVNS